VEPCMLLDRQEHHANAVFACRRQSESETGTFAREELVRNLDQHSGAIAGLGVATASATMGQVDQYLNAFENDVVRLVTFDAGYKPHPARIVLISRIIQTLGRRQTASGRLDTGG
jgi:hypothetical protein